MKSNSKGLIAAICVLAMAGNLALWAQEQVEEQADVDVSAEETAAPARENERFLPAVGTFIAALWMMPPNALRFFGEAVEEFTESTGEAVDDSVLSDRVGGAVVGAIIGHQSGHGTGGAIIGAIVAPASGGIIETSGDVVDFTANLAADVIEVPLKVVRHLPVIGRIFGGAGPGGRR